MIASDFEQNDTLEHAQLDRSDDELDVIEANAALNIPPRELQHGDELIFPLMKSAVLQYEGDPSAPTELRLFYSNKEVLFDDPTQFAFGEALSKQSRFVACEAMGWANGEWPAVREMLEQLIEAEVLFYADDIFAQPMKVVSANRESPIPPARYDRPRIWDDDGETMELVTGTPLEIGNLELSVPIFRIIHMYMDADERQVGEANVYPPILRLGLETEWKTCTYEGTRYQPDAPINATALRAMRAHWRQMMAILLQAREAYFKRVPKAREGWTVGEMERFSVVILAVPTYLMMRRDNPVKNGDLHPALSSLFRVTDGLRLSMHQMLFVPFGEPTRDPDTPMTADEVFAYAERNHSLHSDYAVCAGPPFMIREFLAVMFDGVEPAVGPSPGFDPQVQDALDNIETIIDYAMLGLQSHAATFSHWPLMARTHDELYQIIDGWAGERSPSFETFYERSTRHYKRLTTETYLSKDEWRSSRLMVYADMYASCVFGQTGAYPERTLDEHRHALDTDVPDNVNTQLSSAFERFFALPSMAPLAADLANKIASYIRRIQALLILSEDIQDQINTLLGRKPATKRFTGHNLDLYNQMLEMGDRGIAFILQEFGDLLDITISVTAESITINDGATPKAVPLLQNSGKIDLSE
jgi:hypothetical protein